MTDVETEVGKRKDGFLSICKTRGVPCAVSETIGTDNFSSVSDFLSAHIHGGKLDYDGLFCVSDSLAYLVRSYLSEHGIAVPDDVQIIGYDGIRKFGFLDFFCSTIVQPVEEISRTCVDLILNAGPDRKSVPSLICLPIRYADGGTTKEPV